MYDVLKLDNYIKDSYSQNLNTYKRRPIMRQSIILSAVLMVGLLTFSPVNYTAAQSSTDSARLENEPYDKNELIIQFKQNTNEKTKQALIKSISAVEASKLTDHHFSLLTLPKGSTLEAAAKSLLSHPEILSAEPNYKLEHTYIPTDSDYSKQWYLKNLNLPDTWDLPKGKTVIKTAVIDGGVQVSHFDLKGQVTKPFNVITRKKTLLPNDHGTHIAGVIAAVQDNEGTSGIAPSSKIIPVNVFREEEADIYDVAEGIYYAIDAGADIINLSLTTDAYTNILDEAVQAAAARGIVVIAAAGNEHTAKPRYPAALKNVLGISATDKNDKLASFSNFGKYIDFSAPGKDIYSTISENTFGTMSGTSMASPMVSGVTALILAKNPFLTPSEVLSILKESSTDLGPSGWDPQFGNGKIDAHKALVNTPESMSTLELSDKSFTVEGSNKLNISFTPPKDTTISLYVENANGQTIKKMLTNQASTGEPISYNWDGKLDNGSYQSSGDVKLVIKTANGRHSLITKKSLEVTNTLVPELTVSKTNYLYSPKAQAKLSIPIQLNKDAVIKAVILDKAGNKVRTLQKNKPFTGGRHTLEWNGTNSNRSQLKDGSYTLSISLIDSDGRVGSTKEIPITLDTVPPSGSIVNSDISFKTLGKSKIKNTITVTESVAGSVSIIDKNGKIVNRLLTDTSFKIGQSSVTWNGQTKDKKAAINGDYRFKVILRDKAGNSRIIKSPSFHLINA